MWRDDGVYDVVVVLGHNDDPPVAGMGSAVFLHVTRPLADGAVSDGVAGSGAGFEPTAGCVALPLPDLLAVLARCGPGDRLVVPAP
jgi:L,D-peptidoglycan transpeptidase YkuD (ErfK/YbiS/YcfS/YnhG family)